MQHERGLKLTTVCHPSNVAFSDFLDKRCRELKIRESEHVGLRVRLTYRRNSSVNERTVAAVAVQKQERVKLVHHERPGHVFEQVVERVKTASDSPPNRKMVRREPGPDGRRH
jgi:hypothetical protein